LRSDIVHVCSTNQVDIKVDHFTKAYAFYDTTLQDGDSNGYGINLVVYKYHITYVAQRKKQQREILCPLCAAPKLEK
jgi:hypothetical protein